MIPWMLDAVYVSYLASYNTQHTCVAAASNKYLFKCASVDPTSITIYAFRSLTNSFPNYLRAPNGLEAAGR